MGVGSNSLIIKVLICTYYFDIVLFLAFPSLLNAPSHQNTLPHFTASPMSSLLLLPMVLSLSSLQRKKEGGRSKKSLFWKTFSRKYFIYI